MFISNLKRFKGLDDAVEQLGDHLICTSNISTDHAVNYASYLNEEEIISDNVGPPMEESYARNFGLSGELLKKAVRYHKEYAMQKGYRELRVYDGIVDLLNELHRNGIHTAVATLKAQTTADKIAEEYFPGLFDLVVGTNLNNPMTKAEILLECVGRLQVKKENAVLIGDSIYDADGAAAAGIDFIAVTYGFGFRSDEKIPAEHIAVVDKPDEICSQVCIYG